MKNFNQQPLSKVATIIMGQSPSGETYNESKNGLPLLNGPTEFGTFYPIPTLYTTDSKRECQAGDLIFCVRGSTTGRMNWANQVFSLGRGVCAIRGNSPLETKFLAYCLTDKLLELLQLAGGGTFPNLTKDTLHNFKIPFPESRFEIATILSAYDDLIENNTRRIQILEEMARMIYREWFVNFRFPGHEQAKFVESQLGRIPEGWNIVPLGEIYQTSSGGTPSRKIAEYYGGDILWVKTGELKDSFVFDTEEKITKFGLKNSSARIFPANTVLIAMYGATIGQLGILAQPATTNQACCAVLPKTKEYTHLYGYLTLLQCRKELIQLGMGAAQQNISQVVIKNFPCLKPPSDIVARFSETIERHFDLIKLLQKKNTILKQTRDLLLPKLISGQIDVSDLDIQV